MNWSYWCDEPVNDVEHMDELVVLGVTEVGAEQVEFDLGLYVPPDANKSMLEFGAHVLPLL